MFTRGIMGSIPLSLSGVKFYAEERIAYSSGMEKTKTHWHCSAQVRSSACLNS